MNQSKKPERSSAKTRIVFLIGHPRSGTTWLMWLLAQHPAVASCNHAGLFHALQPLQVWWKTRTPFAKTIHVFQRADESQVEAEYTQVKLADRLRSGDFADLVRPLAGNVFEAIAAAKPGATVAVEQTPENATFFDWIHPILPDAYFLHIYRDPRAVAASMRQALQDWASPDDFPSHPVQIASSWNRYMDLGEHIRGKTERYMSVSYEQLRGEGAPVLEQIFRWLDLETTGAACARYIEASTIDQLKKKNPMPRGFFRRGQAKGWEKDLKPAQIRAIEYVAANWMGSLGYQPRFPSSSSPPLLVRWHRLLSGFQFNRLPGRIRRYMDRQPVLRRLLRYGLQLRRTFRGMTE